MASALPNHENVRLIGSETDAVTISRLILIDYGMGNLGSVSNAFACLGQKVDITNDPSALQQGDAFSLPGVGAFGEAISKLTASGLSAALEEQVVKRRKPLLGICLGMQLLAEQSSEHGMHHGLGWVKGNVRAIPPAADIRIPHVGWSETNFFNEDPMFRNISAGTCFYFDHSFRLECDHSMIAATTRYGTAITAAIRQENIFATQFHPEKSQRAGLKLLRNFLNFAVAWNRD